MVGGIVLACSTRADASFVASEGLLDVPALPAFAVGPAAVATRRIRLGAAVGPVSEPAAVRAGGDHPRR
ncbi:MULTISPECIES: hypothetical protein [unclassified Pseudonocardia]|uniref:hypothetical protein n=1 Tax=unclassified Pseudonocardia TaxID=2619320 RepID=UPI001CF6A7A6|nr:hypothetical protein [Pseudonocardia sp. ICBG601]